MKYLVGTRQKRFITYIVEAKSPEDAAEQVNSPCEPDHDIEIYSDETEDFRSFDPVLAPGEEQLIYSPIVYDGEGNAKLSESFYQAVRNYVVGGTVTQHAGAPGIGSVTYEITRIDQTGVYGKEIENTIRELTPEEVR
jgi:hypothetical protein